MRLLVYLPHSVRAFQPTPQQLAALAAQASGHQLSSAQTEQDFLAALPHTEAALVWRFLPEWYPRAPALRHLFTPSAGREPFAPDPGGHVQLHFGSFHGAIMAESLVAMLSFMNRRFGEALRAQTQQRWDRSPYSATRRLHGQVVLLIGYGAIGQHCGRVLSLLGMQVHALRRDKSRPSPAALRVFTPTERQEALALADHVVCVLPGDTGTDHFLDSAAFSSMKPSACVYNLGRGNAVDPAALQTALSHGRIAGAFLDVLPEEPLPLGSPLWTTPNLYFTPHASAINADYLDLYFEELTAQLATLQ